MCSASSKRDGLEKKTITSKVMKAYNSLVNWQKNHKNVHYLTKPSKSNLKGHTKKSKSDITFLEPWQIRFKQTFFRLVIFLNRSSRENTETCRDGTTLYPNTQTNQKVSFTERVFNRIALRDKLQIKIMSSKAKTFRFSYSSHHIRNVQKDTQSTTMLCPNGIKSSNLGRFVA